MIVIETDAYVQKPWESRAHTAIAFLYTAELVTCLTVHCATFTC